METNIQKLGGLPAVYLSDWYYTKVTYPLRKTGSYFDETKYSFVYVIFNKVSNLYKIGITSQIKHRLRQLRTQSGCEIDLVLLLQLHTGYDEDAVMVESLLHEYFKQKRTFGEWFNLDIKCLLSIRCLFFKIEGEDIIDNLKSHLNSKSHAD
jgi:predicted GIY-YIG superfamily endonuclease